MTEQPVAGVDPARSSPDVDQAGQHSPAPRTTPAIELVEVSKSFPGVRALRDVSLAVEAGSVHALCGENGAGKSTLIKIATGAITADSGQLRVGGELLAHPSRRATLAKGIRAVYQERQIAPDLSVTENILLDALPTRRGCVDWRGARSLAGERLESIGIDIDLDSPISQLNVAQLQLIEIARAVTLDARMIVMDEPTASLGRHEVQPLFDVIERLKTAGVAVLFISHHLDEVFAVADDVTVMRDGTVVDRGHASGFTTERVVEGMFGAVVEHPVDRGLAPGQTEHGESQGRPVLELRDVNSTRLRSFDLTVAAGEIVAVTGGLGAGVSEVAHVAAGSLSPSSGTVLIVDAAGTQVALRNRRRAMRRGVALLPADRKRQGLMGDRSIADNIALGAQAAGRGLLMPPRAVADLGRRIVPQAGVKAANIDVDVSTLSGGNQQKVMFGRWMGVASTLIVLDEPTAGIDISSKFEIYAELRRLARSGMAVLVCSTDFQEVGHVADRVHVLRHGRIVGEVNGEDATEARLLEMEMTA